MKKITLTTSPFIPLQRGNKIRNWKFVAVAFVTFLFVTFANPESVFQHTFNNIPGVGDINTSNTISGRQFGKLAPLYYSEIGTPGSLVGDAAPFPGKLNWDQT